MAVRCKQRGGVSGKSWWAAAVSKSCRYRREQEVTDELSRSARTTEFFGVPEVIGPADTHVHIILRFVHTHALFWLIDGNYLFTQRF